MEYSEAKEFFTKMAKDIISMEKAEDSSMRGVYLDELVTYYIQEQFVDVVAMYEYIIEIVNIATILILKLIVCWVIIKNIKNLLML